MTEIDFTSDIQKELAASAEVKLAVALTLPDCISRACNMIVDTFQHGGKILLVGNGGSAADAQHIAADFTGKFRKERPGLPALALHTDTSILTALANDYKYPEVFKRILESISKPEDLLIALSTSGNSQNILEAATTAKILGIKTIGLTGQDGGKLAELVNIAIRVPSTITSHIQESHIAIGHYFCKAAEDTLFKNE